MSHRKFVVTSSLVILVTAGLIGGLAVYTSFGVKASVPGLPEAVNYLPADTQAVFGINVKKFIESPVYAKFESKHENHIGQELNDFIAKTGVDPRKDLTYVVAGGRSFTGTEGSGVAIGVGQFDNTRITSFIVDKLNAVKLDHHGTTILMPGEKDGSKLEKGIAFLSISEIALGSLDALKTTIDVRAGSTPGIASNATMSAMIKGLNPDEMFWFAGDASNIAAKAPNVALLQNSLGSVKDVVGTLNLTDSVSGKIVANARDEESARKLADIAKGVVALGQLAGDYNADVAELLKGVAVTQDKTQIRVVVNFPTDLLEKLEHANPKVNLKRIL